ncbi:ABC transporter permease [Hoeflea prorocentri]|uniref:ABC transporter permease n=1 Tax=Hoeflea prorocentri TaxID=1922333 RepID=A0A9X3UIH0_9HYPH|nr:ABC transporter permease [Hoeflea prorocentri]MCY6381947.1 ABC transporter permease [Hoeflea prorocentri]MDA5399747.1 ABC transporter permease [Hoeflea prorocentri]
MKSTLASLLEAKFALGLFVVLMLITLVVTPNRFAPDNLGTTLGLVAPLILAAAAATPVILAGREGIDISIGPLMGMISVLTVKGLILDLGISSPLIIVPFAIAVGAIGGAVNGFLAIVLRIQPIVATLGTYLVLAGIATWYLPSPIGPVPSWLVSLSEEWSILPLLAGAGLWLAVKSTPLHGHIMTIGGEDRAAYAAGLNVARVRFLAYVLGGLFAGLAAISLTALLGSADAQVGPNYTLLAIAAAALGGVSLAGGKGGIAGAALGALDIFLIQNLITYLNVSPFFLQITYGLVLVVAVALNSQVIADKLRARRAG